MSDFHRSGSRQSGFTLLEVMVAVAIFAGIAITISDTASMRVNNLLSMRTMTLASFVAENRLTDIRLAGVPPQAGETNDIVEMAGQEWSLELNTVKTPDANIRQVEVNVRLNPEADPMATVVTYVQKK